MPYEITCPYCFKTMSDDEVAFRSERVSMGENEALPNGYDDREDFEARYYGSDKTDIHAELLIWEFFERRSDEAYERYWKPFGGTTENNPADEVLGVESYQRRVIDPNRKEHQAVLRQQPDGGYLIRDEQGMAIQIELTSGERCHRRVCRYCHNPLPTNYGKNAVRFVSVIGVTGAGKTVYLSQLLRSMEKYVQKVGMSIPGKSPSVVTFLESNSIKAGSPLPASTPAKRLQQPLFYELVRSGKGNGGKITETFVMYDVAGEVFNDESLVQAYAPFIEHSHALILLIDPYQLPTIAGVAGGAVNELDEPTRALSAIHNIVSHGNSDEKCSIPVAVCLSKIDAPDVQSVLDDGLRADLLSDVQGVMGLNGLARPIFNAGAFNPMAEKLNDFVIGRGEGLAQLMYTNYMHYNYFAFTALGCGVEKRRSESGSEFECPVGPVIPRHVEEPILWLFNQLGYVGENTPVFNPSNPVCPQCGKQYTRELIGDDRYERRREGLFRHTTVYSTHACMRPECGCRFVPEGYEEQ